MLCPDMIRTMAAVPCVTLADPAQNAREIAALLDIADAHGVQLCVFPELCLTGATCGDLLAEPALLTGALAALRTLMDRQTKTAFVVGLPIEMDGRLYDCAAVVSGGKLALVPKQHADHRLFAPGHTAPQAFTRFGEAVPVGSLLRIDLGGFSLGVQIGEDAFSPVPAAARLAQGGAQIIANPAASCALAGRHEALRRMMRRQSECSICGYVYAGAGFGESTTDMVFPGDAAILETGTLLAENARYARTSTYAIADIDAARLRYRRTKQPELLMPEDTAAVRCIALPAPAAASGDALMRPVKALPFIPEDADAAARYDEILMIQTQALITRMAHIRCQKAALGVSGGLDSTLALLVAALAFDRAAWPRDGIIGITMPGFGTGSRTRSNADRLMEAIGCTMMTVPIGPAVTQHFADIGHDGVTPDICFENSQARERTQIVMDYANKAGALALGTGDLSELALGFCTYNGDHMSMYGVNATVPKTLMQRLVCHAAAKLGDAVLSIVRDIVDTPISPELLPTKDGELQQKTEETLGAYALHDFFLYHMMDSGASPRKLYALALHAFGGQYTEEATLAALRMFVRRFFTQQFKRSCMPDGPKVGTVSLSPRGDWKMPSDAKIDLWLREVDSL